MNKSQFVLNLNSDAFNGLKLDFNNMLRKILATMTQKESENGEITIKLKITLTEGMAPDIKNSSYHADREIFSPKFEHSITSTIQIKDKATGYVGGDDYELVWDKRQGEYVMLPVKDAQKSFFDEPDEEIGTDLTEIKNTAGEPEIACLARENGTCDIIKDCECCCIDCCDQAEGCQNACETAKGYLRQIDSYIEADVLMNSESGEDGADDSCMNYEEPTE